MVQGALRDALAALPALQRARAEQGADYYCYYYYY